MFFTVIIFMYQQICDNTFQNLLITYPNIAKIVFESLLLDIGENIESILQGYEVTDWELFFLSLFGLKNIMSCWQF